MTVKINSREELYDFLKNTDTSTKKDTKYSSVYYLVTFKNKTIPIYFMHFQDSYFESPCSLSKVSMSLEELSEYVKEIYVPESYEDMYKYELNLYKDGMLYDIDVPQCSPFLPSKLDNIEIVGEKECLEFLLRNK